MALSDLTDPLAFAILDVGEIVSTVFVWFTMGRKFGSLTKGKNIVTYSLSPFEQRAFAGVTKSIANMARRVRTQLPYQLPAFISGILLYTWAMEDFRQRNRKNPKDFENDE